MSLLKRQLPAGILLVVSVLYCLNYFLSGVPELSNLIKVLGNWAVICSAIALSMGFLNLLIIHTRSVQRRGKNYEYSLLTIIIMVLSFGLGAYGGVDWSPFRWIFDNLYTPTGQAFFNISFFYTCAAAYIALRIRSIESMLLFLSTILGIAGRTQVLRAYWGGFQTISDWILATPSGGAYTGMYISVALGAVLVALRVMAGIERTYLGVEGAG